MFIYTHITKRAIGALSVILFLNGCSTVKTFDRWKYNPTQPIVYAGTRESVRHMTEGQFFFPSYITIPVLLLDLTFSFTADTVLLPYSIPAALISQPTQKTEPKPESQPQKHESPELPHSDVDSPNKRNPFLKN